MMKKEEVPTEVSLHVFIDMKSDASIFWKRLRARLCRNIEEILEKMTIIWMRNPNSQKQQAGLREW